MPNAHTRFSMIRANCRERFTATDFDFVVRTLARSRIDHVSLVELLGDAETRDAVLDNPRLVDAILSNAGHLRISSQFYFYILARYVLQQAGIGDRKLGDYVGSLLENFSRANQLQSPDKIDNRAHEYISDMLIALTRATPEQTFLLRAHAGNYSLFISGIFHESTQRRSLRGEILMGMPNSAVDDRDNNICGTGGDIPCGSGGDALQSPEGTVLIGAVAGCHAQRSARRGPIDRRHARRARAALATRGARRARRGAAREGGRRRGLVAPMPGG